MATTDINSIRVARQFHATARMYSEETELQANITFTPDLQKTKAKGIKINSQTGLPKPFDLVGTTVLS